MYDMTLDLPNLAKGAEVEIDGLGLFENGYTYEIPADLADTFRRKHQRLEGEYNKQGRFEGTIVHGPTLLEAFKNHEGIEVAVHKEEKSPKNDDKSKGDDTK